MKVSVQEVDPGAAEMLLEGNLGNRKISQRIVDSYANEMREGRWRPNGSSISIYWDGEKWVLLNGQHRLLALIAAGITIEFVIVEEDTPEVFSVLDQNYIRTTAQVLAMAGFSNTNVTQAMARYAINYDKFAQSPEPWPRSDIRTPKVLEWLRAQDQQKIMAVVNDFTHMRSLNPHTNTWYAGLDWLVRAKSPNASEWMRFHEAYRTGVALPSGSPVLALRQYTLNRTRTNGRYSQNPWDRQAHLAVGIKAWNDFLLGDAKSRTYYRFTKGMLPMPEVR